MPPESRDPKSIRFAPAEWQPFIEGALLRDMEPSALVRDCALIGLNVLSSPALMEAYCRALSVMRAGARVSVPASTPVVLQVSHANGNGAKR